MIRVRYEELKNVFRRVLVSRGFTEERAEAAAEVFAMNSLDGVYSHGINRFPLVVSYLDKGRIDPNAVAECVSAQGVMERWDGHLGFGPLNAKLAMERACELAKVYGMGLVALGNTNHWMRGGTYGQIAANRGCIGICWSNTQPNMPAWGGVDKKIGNNPLIFAVPRSNGEHVIVDCAMSQFSYGKIEEAKLNGLELPVSGGYDEGGNLTTDPTAIERSCRLLPMGYWKGSGISILLDLIATILTDGNSVHRIGTFDDEVGLSQVMIAIDPSKFQSPEVTDRIVDEIIADIHTSVPAEDGKPVICPYERSLRTRRENLVNGIPVNEGKWEQIKNLL